jgi:hypothetical protein
MTQHLVEGIFKDSQPVFISVAQTLAFERGAATKVEQIVDTGNSIGLTERPLASETDPTRKR